MNIDGLRSIILFLIIVLHKLTLRYLGSKGSQTMLFNKLLRIRTVYGAAKDPNAL